MKTSLILAAAFALVASPVVAQELSKSVKVADLDLSTAQGQKKLDARIAAAARTVCSADVSNTGTRMASTDAKDCVRRAIAQTRSALAANDTKRAALLGQN